MKKEKRKNQKNIVEDTTKYGEFVSSYFAWKTLDEQKEIVNKLSNITERDNE